MSDSEKSKDQVLDGLRREASRIEEDSTYSSKGHFNAAACWKILNYVPGGTATVLSATAGLAFVKTHPNFAASVSGLSSILMALMTFINPNRHESAHREAGGLYLALKNKCRFIREIELRSDTDIEKKTGSLRIMSDALINLNQKSPSIPFLAFTVARKGIEQGESTHQIDKIKEV